MRRRTVRKRASCDKILSMVSLPKRHSFARPLADLIGATLDPLMARQGFGAADVILNWEDIAGERLAAVTEPLRMQWPTRAPLRSPDAAVQPATLVLRVEGAFALEVQHLIPVLCERVNAHLGWRCIGRIALRQGPIERKPGPRRVALPIDAAALREAESSARGIENDDLRRALTRLGSRVLAKCAKS